MNTLINFIKVNFDLPFGAIPLNDVVVFVCGKLSNGFVFWWDLLLDFPVSEQLVEVLVGLYL